MINLLPTKIKKEQKLRQISNQVNVAIFTLLIMVAMSYSAVYLVDYFLSSQIDKNNDLLAQTAVQISKMKPVEDDISAINAKLTKIDTLKNQRYDWSTVIADLNNSIPSNVQIKSIQLESTTDKVNLSAVAETRSDIVKLQAALEDLPYLKNMSFNSSTFNEASNYYSFSMIGSLGK